MPAVTNEDECDEIKNGAGSNYQETHSYPMIYTMLHGTEILPNSSERSLPQSTTILILQR
jgi:hypothetical protein